MPPSLIGKTLLNRYRIEEFVTLTPLGELHRVTDERTNQPLALTLLSKAVAENIEAVKELEAKSGTLQSVSHPNVNKYLGLFQTPTLAFLLEEWVDGPSLQDVLEHAPLSAQEAVTFVKAICNALDALHKGRHLHLNLAPELIRINGRGEVILCGIANAHPIGEGVPRKLGKYPLYYTSPEEFNEQPLSAAADLYALAVMLYELVTGAWINGGKKPKTLNAIRKTHLESTPPAPASLNKKVPDHFSRMVLWALRKNPQDRLKTTTELLSSLALALRIPVDDIPLRAKADTAPVTSAILSEWQFLPPPKPVLLREDVPPLEDRLGTLAPPPQKKKRRIGLMPILALVLMAGIISLSWFLRPAEIQVTLPETFTPFVLDYTPPPTFTPIPRPTDPHGGRIAFTCTRGDYNQLCMINRDGTGLIQLTDMAASNYYPVFTTDGASLLFASNRNGPFDLYLLVFSEREIRQITRGVGNVISPEYSPDGRTILFANRAGRVLLRSGW
jgi:serine/threonine protein kinase